MEPEHFISEVLVRRLKVAAIVIGRDWRFGKDRKGTISMLKALGQELSFRVELVPPVLHEGRIISSTMIRELVQSGQVRLAHELMGTAPTLIGTIVQGDGRGRLLGYPTANLSVAPELVRPAEGVYAVRAHYRSTTKDGILYIGKRPTFDGKSQAIEVHLFDTSGDLYDLEMKVDLLYYLRGDQYFSDISSLQEQMRADAAKARDLLAKSVIPQERSVRYESAK
jgi:riboflavin kinase/FMN adenylyltransferase